MGAKATTSTTNRSSVSLTVRSSNTISTQKFTVSYDATTNRVKKVDGILQSELEHSMLELTVFIDTQSFSVGTGNNMEYMCTHHIWRFIPEGANFTVTQCTNAQFDEKTILYFDNTYGDIDDGVVMDTFVNNTKHTLRASVTFVDEHQKQYVIDISRSK
jgi:hypothetical protein